MSSECPKCHLNDMAIKVSYIFTSGFSHTATQSGPTLGVGLYKGKIGVGVGGGSSSTGISVSELSMRLKPPEKPKGFGCLVPVLVCIIGGFVLAYAINNIIPLIIGVAGLIFWMIKLKQLKDEKERIYDSLMAEWNSMYYCQRDDVVFIPGKSTTKSPESLQSYFSQMLS
jgi:hypothetical protein